MFRLPVENLLGRCRLADEWKDLVKMLEDSFKEHAPTMQLQVDEKSFTDVFYIRFRPFGLEFCFDRPTTNDEDSILSWPIGAIHVYNEKSGFSKCPLELPDGMTVSMRAKEIVKLLGEPDKKYGGKGTPITIAFTKRSLKIEIEFLQEDWYNPENEIQSIVFFQ